MIRVEIEGEPIGKARPRVCNGHAFTPQKTADYEELVKLCFKTQNKADYCLTGAVSVEIKAYFGVPKSDSKEVFDKKIVGKIKPTKKPDIDNVAKIILDALNGLAFADDKQVVELNVKKAYSLNPRVEVTVSEVNL